MSKGGRDKEISRQDLWCVIDLCEAHWVCRQQRNIQDVKKGVWKNARYAYDSNIGKVSSSESLSLEHTLDSIRLDVNVANVDKGQRQMHFQIVSSLIPVLSL